MQRDRDFDHYQDDGVFYDRRPSLWVEPLGDWGAGAVQLVEIPTDDEIHDNIVAFWVPARAGAGRRALVVRLPPALAGRRALPPDTSPGSLRPAWAAGGVPGQPRPPARASS